jgi:hypothetical protein
MRIQSDGFMPNRIDFVYQLMTTLSAQCFHFATRGQLQNLKKDSKDNSIASFFSHGL